MTVFETGLRFPRLSASASLALAAILLTGCFPSSCNPRQSRALLPADSLSRQIAAQTPVDTLRQLWQTDLEAAGLENPRTLLFGPDGRLYVSDTEQHRVYVFDASGQRVQEIASEGFRHPYLAGFRGDTLLVYTPLARRVDFVAGGAVRGGVTLEGRPPSEEALEYVAASDSAYYLKVLSEEHPGYVARFDARGREVARAALPGAHWRFAGFLRLWGDSLVSLSGYRPLVNIWTASGLDTLALRGFDSPMLARTRLYLLGQSDDAPLLTSSAAVSGDRLFVINLRPGWLQVDVYGRDGGLRHVLVQPDAGRLGELLPADLAVRRSADGGYEIAVLTIAPKSLRLYRWDPAVGP